MFGSIEELVKRVLNKLSRQKLWMMLIIGFVWVMILPSLIQRLRNESMNKTVEIAIDLEEVKVIVESLPKFLEKAKNIGVSSVGIYAKVGGRVLPALERDLEEETYASIMSKNKISQYSKKEVRLVGQYHLMPVFRLSNFQFMQNQRNLLWFPPSNEMGSVLPWGKEAIGSPHKIKQAGELIRQRKWRFLFLDMSRQSGLKSLAKQLKDRIVLTHSIEKRVWQTSTESKTINRFVRAVKERSVRFLYVRTFPFMNEDKYLKYLNDLTSTLAKEGFMLGHVQPYSYYRSRTTVRKNGSFVIALFGILGGVLCLVRIPKKRMFLRFGIVSFISITSGAVIASLLSTPDFALRLEMFRGTKIALMGPLIFSVPILYKWEELKKRWNSPLRFKDFVLIVGVVSFFFYVVLRSGNWSFVIGEKIEMVFRNILEVVFGIRPRFKEFLIGHPILLLGLWLNKRSMKGIWDGRFMILVGVIGQTSIVNSFCHAHTPLQATLWRTFHGLWMGLIIGLILIISIKKLEPTFRRLLRL